jgi:biopolymer transport protein ExbD
VQINITPAIDVIFSILAFLIVSTLFLSRSQGLPVNLPSADTDQIQPSATVTVSILPDGMVAVNQEPIALAELRAVVAGRVGAQANPLAIVAADATVPHGQVVAVMDQLRRVPNLRLAIETAP